MCAPLPRKQEWMFVEISKTLVVFKRACEFTQNQLLDWLSVADPGPHCSKYGIVIDLGSLPGKAAKGPVSFLKFTNFLPYLVEYWFSFQKTFTFFMMVFSSFHFLLQTSEQEEESQWIRLRRIQFFQLAWNNQGQCFYNISL